MTLEKCPDPIDDGANRQNEANEQALAQMRVLENRRRQAVQAAIDDGNFDQLHCIKCGEEIPPLRLKMVVMHCTDCATTIENKKRTYA